MTDLLSLTLDGARAALGDWVAARGEPRYRVKQIVPRLWQRPVSAWDEARELPAALRRDLAEAFPLVRLQLGAHQVSRDST
ncbi:MAG: 23S rRNA (adenine(2503)-C(2))-methyltransferase RlmN, partial [bacterium]